MSPVRARRAVRLTLLQLRANKGLNRRAVAEAMHCAETKIGHLETGRNLPSYNDLKALLDIYQRPDLLGQLSVWSEISRQKGWWEGRLDPGTPAGFDSYVGQESAATTLLMYDPVTVAGLCQTAQFADALVRTDPARPSAEARATRVELRMQRQLILDRADPPRLHVITTEGVLRQVVGGADVMRPQLGRLVELANRPTITFQVIPFTVGAFPGQHAFRILEFADDDQDEGSVYVETRLESKWHEEPPAVAEYRLLFAELARLAADEPTSIRLAQKIAEEMS